MPLKHAKTSAAPPIVDPAIVDSEDWNADHAVVDYLDFPAPAGSVVAPAAGNVRAFMRSVAGRALLAAIGPDGIATVLQEHLARNFVSVWMANGNSTVISQLGAQAIVGTGTSTAANVATTSRYTRFKRVEYLITTASASAVAGNRAANLQATVGGPTAGDGGFHMIYRWGPATGVSNASHRGFCGMSSLSAAPTDVNPSTVPNIIGMGWDTGDATISMMHRGAGAVTKISLGAGFPRPTVDRACMFELALFSPPGPVPSCGYEVTDLITGAVAAGEITTNLPDNNVLLGPRSNLSVGGVSSVVGVSFVSAYLSRDL